MPRAPVGRHRVGAGMGELAGEPALRSAVIKRWTGQLCQVTSSDLDEVVRFGECVDQALAESLSVHLEQVGKSRNLLLGVLGPDLRNPLGAVSMSAQYLLRTHGLDVPHTKAVGRIVNSADNMKRMVDDLLDSGEHGLERGHEPQEGEARAAHHPLDTASAVTEDTASAKLGKGAPAAGHNPGNGPVDRVRVDSSGQLLTTNMGVAVAEMVA